MSIARAEGETARLGLIGPNAVTQMAAALSDACGAPLRRDVFEDAGLARYLCAPPTHMIPEDDVARLHRAAIDRLGEAKAAEISREAGRRTGDYLLANRIPAFVQRALKITAASARGAHSRRGDRAPCLDVFRKRRILL